MDDKVKDTMGLQMESLRIFMGSLSYTPARANGGFYTDLPLLASRSQLSTRTAIRLHNLDRSDWDKVPGKDLYTPSQYSGMQGLFEVTAAGLAYIQAMKLVKEVKFTPTKRAPNGLLLKHENCHLVKANSELVAEMLEKYIADPTTPYAEV